MSELIRFRLARAPQRLNVEADARVPIYFGPNHGQEAFEAAVGSFLSDLSPYVVDFQSMGMTLLNKPASLFTPIDQLEKWLIKRRNHPSHEALSAKLNELNRIIYDVQSPILPSSDDLGGNARLLMERAGDNWWIDRQNIGFSLIAAMIRDPEPSRAMYFNRLMLIFGLIELAAENPDRLRTANDVYWALRWRMVVLPKILLEYIRNLRPHSLLARRPGFADLYIVRDEWARYEAGEIAHVENIMAGETRERRHTRTTETEETVTSEEERSKLDEHDMQTTDRFDLHTETSRDSSLSAGVDGSVEASGQFGPVKVSTHLGGNLDYSLDESQSQATTTSHEIVARAVTRVEERVRQVRTTRSLSRIKEINAHAFKNDSADAKHITGIYRWVDKIKRVQVFRYPNRFLLEFQVPEPGAWLRWLLDKKKAPVLSEKPDDLKFEITVAAGDKKMVDLTPEYIKDTNYIEIAARYKTLGLNPPPTSQIIATVLTRPSPEDPATEIKESSRFKTDNLLTVPEGYKAADWKASIQAFGHSQWANALSLTIAVGSGVSINKTDTTAIFFVLKGSVGDISKGIIPISIATSGAIGFNANISVTCLPLPETITAWQIDTYSKIAQAYYAMRRQYDEEVAAQSVRNSVKIEGFSPLQNAEMTRTELKKAVIEMLTAADFSGRNGYQTDISNKRLQPPEIDLQKAVQIAPEIQFMEQAFEWENLSYVLYPYFWAGKDYWDQLADLSGADPDFARFLRAGSARVVLPARPGFELQVMLYTQLGILWGGGPAPGPDEDDYFSIADEIRAQEKPPRDGIPGESWEVRLPTTLVWLDPVNSSLPVDNPTIELDAPPGKVLP